MQEELLTKQNTSAQAPPSRRGYSLGVLLFAFVAAAIIGGVAGSFSESAFEKIHSFWSGNASQKESAGSDRDVAASPIEPSADILSDDENVIEVVRRSTPSVVSIIVTKDIPTFRGFSSPFDMFFGDPFQALPEENDGETEKQQVGGGTGFFVSRDGMIVTNRHVVSDQSAEYTVILNDGTEYEAMVLARDPIRDIALMQVKGSDFPTLEFGDSDALQVGQTVIAIGNSLGEFSNSVSRGIVSGLSRDIVAGSGRGDSERLTDIIQTDAAINPGNSGGPLLDIYGRVIGINTAVAQDAENVGFALPINAVENTIVQVKETGEISVPFLGVRYIILDETIQKENNLEYDYGALVLRGERVIDFAVLPGSPADKAGIVENDIILEMNEQKITSENQLSDMIGRYQVGDEITLKIAHRGEEKEVHITLEKRE